MDTHLCTRSVGAKQDPPLAGIQKGACPLGLRFGGTANTCLGMERCVCSVTQAPGNPLPTPPTPCIEFPSGCGTGPGPTLPAAAAGGGRSSPAATAAAVSLVPAPLHSGLPAWPSHDITASQPARHGPAALLPTPLCAAAGGGQTMGEDGEGVTRRGNPTPQADRRPQSWPRRPAAGGGGGKGRDPRRRAGLWLPRG